MNSITIITIVVVALLTLIIFGLIIMSYKACLKTYKLEVNHGKYDKQIKKEYSSKRKSLFALITSWLAFGLLLSLLTSGIIYKASGNNFIFNNQTALVIKSNSMSNFYDEKIANDLDNDRSLQFEIGDICLFEKVSQEDELLVGQVYGYKYKNIIITHRLVSIDNTYCKFRGDNNKTFDGSVSRESVIFHYVGKKLPKIGTFILYAQSYFGIATLLSIIGVIIGLEIVYHKVDEINKARFKIICPILIESQTKKKTRRTKDEVKKKHNNHSN